MKTCLKYNLEQHHNLIDSIPRRNGVEGQEVHDNSRNTKIEDAFDPDVTSSFETASVLSRHIADRD